MTVELKCNKKTWNIERILRIDPHEGCDGNVEVWVKGKEGGNGGAAGIRVKG